VLARDILATQPHLTFTIYDETALALRRVTGLGFQQVLTAGQLVVHALRILGVYLIARGLRLSTAWSLLVAAIFSLGASVVGAGNTTIELEPVPRTFSFPLIILAMGLIAHGRDLAAATLASIALLYHPPTVYPFWAVYLCLALWPADPAIRKRRLWGFAPLFCAVALLLLSAHCQPGAAERQALFSRLDPFQVELQRKVAMFVWVSMWPLRWFEHQLFLWVAALVACWRIKEFAGRDLKFVLFGFPIVGMLSMPASYLLLEKLRWSFISQFEPMRALVFLPIVVIIAGAAAAMRAIAKGRYVEGFLWFVLVFAIPIEPRVLHILWPRPSAPLMVRRALIVLLLAFCAGLAVWAETRRIRGSRLMLATAALLPFFLLPFFGKVNRYQVWNTAELARLAAWARTSTANDAVFLFPDADLEPYPGIFRATALRAVYVDWRSGLQAKTFKEFGEEWWSRWQKTMAAPFNPRHLERYQGLGIDYLAVQSDDRVPGATAVYENSKFIVYRLKY